MTVPVRRAAAEMAAVAEKRIVTTADQIDQSIERQLERWKSRLSIED